MRRGLLVRGLAAIVIVAAYFLSVLGIVGLTLTTGSTSAQARGRGRGFGRGIGVGIGLGLLPFAAYDGYYYGGYYGPYRGNGCWWSRRYQRWVCPGPYYRGGPYYRW
jgi:hypothetical protein